MRGGRAKPAHHAHKILSTHGAKTSAPRQGADPSAAQVRRCFVRLSAHQMNLIQREEIRFWNRRPLTSFPENCLMWPGAGLRPAPGHIFTMHGARTPASLRGAAPSAAQGLRSFSANPNWTLDKTQRLERIGFPFFLISDCFWWVPAGLRPAGTHQKLFLCTGRERRHPAQVRTRPRPRYS